MPSSKSYESRTDKVGISSRPDPVVWPSDQFVIVPQPLAEAQLVDYEKNGFVRLKQLFRPDELTECIRELTDMEASHHGDAQRVTEDSRVVTELGGRALRSLFAVHEDASSAVARCALSQRVVSCAQQILGGDVYVHQSRVNFQRAFQGNGFSWHSDFETWHAEDGMRLPRSLSAVIFLDRNCEVSGPLLVIPGSHRHFVACPGRQEGGHWETSLQSQAHGTPGERETSLLAEDGGVVACTGEAGDVLFFDCNLLHCSPCNRSPWHRRNLFVAFNAAENCLEAPFYSDRQRPEHVGHRLRCALVRPLPASE